MFDPNDAVHDEQFSNKKPAENTNEDSSSQNKGDSGTGSPKEGSADENTSGSSLRKEDAMQDNAENEDKSSENSEKQSRNKKDSDDASKTGKKEEEEITEEKTTGKESGSAEDRVEASSSLKEQEQDDNKLQDKGKEVEIKPDKEQSIEPGQENKIADDTEIDKKEEMSGETKDERTDDEEISSEREDTNLSTDSEEKMDEKQEEMKVSGESAEQIGEEDKHSEEETKEQKENSKPEKKGAEEKEAKKEGDEEEGKTNYAEKTKEELVDILENLINNKSVEQIKDDVENIKIHFYRKHKNMVETMKKKFIDEGGDLLDFKPEPDEHENKFKELLKLFKDLKSEYLKRLEDEKQENLLKKYQIIEEIKDLINNKESINQTFQEFRELQKRWRSIGLVPQQNVKDLWETYHYHVEMFYDYIKINKELRDLDLKKNLEEKTSLCEKAEALLLEPSIISAFKTLQEYHNRWREIGPVPREMRDGIWERFKEITSKINKKHHQHFEQLKEQQKKNLEQKRLLCEKAEEISAKELSSPKEWEENSNELIELQKIWKTIGFAPKKDNNKIYERFRSACDQFFNRKREFYAQNKEEQKNNLQLKTDLCIQAEALQDSTDWKTTTEDLINLQKKWKLIGPVPRKYSDPIWTRFRAACDKFFNRKHEFFSNIDSTYENNLKRKEELIKEIENFKLGNNIQENFKKLNEFQKRWTEIGFVPIKKKDEIQQKYREAINKHFDNLKINEKDKNILKFKNKINNIKAKPRSDQKLRVEREKFLNRLKQLESDIVLWENNIGFFAKSENAESMIEEVQTKIDNAKKTIQMLTEKIRLIDEETED